MTGSLFAALVVLVVVGVVAERIASHLNRRSRRVEAYARQLVGERLARRESVPVVDFVSRLAIDDEDRAVAMLAVKRVARALGVNAGALRTTDVLRDVIRVQRDELPEPVQVEWEQAGLGAFLDVCVYEVLHALESTASRAAWTRALMRIPEPRRPRSEEQWLDWILPLTLGDIVVLFFGR